MSRYESRLSAGSAAFLAARQRMLGEIARVRVLEQRTRDASAAAGPRFARRGQLLPRQRLSLLLDPGAPFLEFSTLAGYRLDDADPDRSVPGGGVVTGIGSVAGSRCVVAVSDSGIDAGALQPRGLDKQLRAQEIALENRLPYVQLVESAGANLLAYRVEDFVAGGNLFRNLARLSASGLPVVTVVHGSSTAGGAYQTGLSDYIVMVRGRSRAFLAGPPLLLAATGEVATEEELGGAEMHTTVSGLGHYLAEDDRDAIRIARELLGTLARGGAEPARAPALPPRHDADELLGVMPADPRQPVDMREVMLRLVDDSAFMEFAERFGSATVCANARLDGHPLGIITNNGPIDADGAAKAARFIQACCQSQVPILYLQNTTGFLVGRAQEEAGIIRHGSSMIRAVTGASVPQITIHCGASYGAGNYGMCGRGFHPRFCFSWPSARTAVMGAEQAARTMGNVLRAQAGRGRPVDEEQVAQLERRIVENFERQMDVFSTSAHLLDDGVIDPRDTRGVLALTLAVCRDAAARAAGHRGAARTERTLP
ncbi:MAG: acyl-CoA carboxylase subunit beta [Steroidobacteraceae bacterium]|jgi:geranyl-CoA carboxylase beta subunit|nr:acyl-CoA carboxylase subunit beta [Steroidobacteraceae bacterium]